MIVSKYQIAVALAVVVFLAGGILFYTINQISDAPLASANPASQESRNHKQADYQSAGLGIPGINLGSLGGTGTKADGSVNTAQQSGDNVTKPIKGIPKTGINVNTASKELLDKLPGIGPVLAERIIRYREDVSFFGSPEDLIKVKGIGEKKLEDILPYIRFK